ncbi:hypothetical protein FZEAL_3715 [Fusarium zealandicum]|uniref:Uncharacterized protein n=1 Tax=Fusarium zealandicum TaxID=1053134 RepID=A0A8H4UNN7_9HYPO|nr:hypothetical protein FZEAL_3715 [Fusarium zealandicum]
MGSTDIAPATAPAWLIPASTACISAGVAFWLLAYVLMVRRSLANHATPAPLVALGLNLAWEVVYAFGVCEAPIETFGFTMWLLLDIPVLYVTLKTAPRTFAASPLVARNVPLLLAVIFVLGLLGNGAFVWWWLKEPHRGYGIKWGKMWKGLEARDTTELSYWSAGVAQTIFSVSALAMLLQRGHSGGQSYAIWACLNPLSGSLPRLLVFAARLAFSGPSKMVGESDLLNHDQASRPGSIVTIGISTRWSPLDEMMQAGHSPMGVFLSSMDVCNTADPKSSLPGFAASLAPSWASLWPAGCSGGTGQRLMALSSIL